MRKPRNVKQAFESGYIVTKIYSKNSSRIRVTMKERFHVADRVMLIDFWIDRDYFKRTYPRVYESF
jgi:hypothetical protein